MQWRTRPPEAIASTKKQSDYYCLQQLVSHCWSCSGVVGAQFEQSHRFCSQIRG
ncbi:hypothetical protein [Chlorogloeopsis sp. ULAP02]|uniref:hypothetical protein n=1 Tax=Chlorogloeopsis sp. ULAP02 TaxID=3107926 RepID=UPI003136735D